MEVDGLREERAKFYANPDGKMTAELGAGPVHVRRNGAWVDIDTTLAVAGAFVRPRAVPGAISFSGGGRVPLATSGDGKHSVSVRWPTALPTPTLSGDTATYADVAPATDITMRALRTGYEQHVVLKDRPRGAPVFRLPLTLAGLDVSKTVSGSLEFTDAGGVVVGRAEAPRMWGAAVDASSGDPARSALIDTRIVRGSDGGVTLELRPDPGFLADPAVTLPITVDPNIHLAHTDDTWVRSTEYYVNHGDSAELPVGTNNAGGQVTRSYLRFDTSPISGKHITASTLALYEWYSYSCVQSETRIYAVADQSPPRWSYDSLYWQTQPPTIPTIYGSTTTNCPGDGWVRWNLNSLTSGWAQGSPVNNGILVRAASETDNNGWKKFYSWNYGQTPGQEGYIPSLSVDYQSDPDVPTLYSPGDGAWTQSSQPQLQAQFSDPDGGSGYVVFRVTRQSDGYTFTSPAVGPAGRAGSRRGRLTSS